MAGAMLRQQREALGLDLTDVAAMLRIKPAYLEALEAGRPDELPGAVYAIGFIRAYADYLGLDNREMLRLFKQQSTLLLGKAGSRFSDPARRAQHARRGNAAGRADPGGLRIRRMVLPVDRRRPAAATRGRSTTRVVAVPGAVSNSTSRLAASRGAGGAAIPGRTVGGMRNTPAPLRPGRVRAAALLLPVRRWPRCLQRLIRRQTRRARSSSGLPPTAGFRSVTCASQYCSRAY